MIRKTRKNLKWLVIAIAAIFTLLGVFSGNIIYMAGLIPLFWIYVFLDKYKNVTKRATLNKLYKDE